MNTALGIDIGGTFIKAAIVDTAEGSIIREWMYPTRPSKEQLLEQLIGITNECITAVDILPSAIGVATPGIIDPSSRVVVGGAPNIEGWEDVALSALLENLTALPTVLCNDGNAMGYGEYRYGAGKGCEDVLFICVGTGIGGAIISDGRMITGHGNRGGEIGCIPFMAEGRRCSCGAEGCWEEYASTAAMTRFYRERTGKELDGRQIVEQYLEGQQDAVEVFETECRYLGRGIAGLINIFAPQRVVIGGGISESGKFFIDKVSASAMDSALPACSAGALITAATLGNKAGMIGAAAYAKEKITKT